MTCEIWQRLILNWKAGKDISRGQGEKNCVWGELNSFMLCACRSDCHKEKSLTTASSVRSFLMVLSVICCCVTNYPETLWLKTSVNCLIVSQGQKSRSGLVMWFWIRVSTEVVVKLSVGLHILKPCLGLEDLLLT